MSDRTSAALGPHAVAADLTFTPEVVFVTYDEPLELPPLSWRWWPRWLRGSGVRRVRRAFVLRPLPLRELLLHQETFAALRRQGVFDLTAAAAVIVGESAIYLPRGGLRAIAEAYRRVNELAPAEEPVVANDQEAGTLAVMFETVVRRLERAPFHIERERALDLTVRQIKARLTEFGEEKLEEFRAQAAMHGAEI